MAAGTGLRTAATLLKLATRKVLRPKPLGPAGGAPFEAAMRRLDIEQLDVCPWALREGVILRRLDQLAPS